MFTIDQIKQAHANVKSGADFPEYVRELKQLGVVSYDNLVSDGRTHYYGVNDYSVAGEAKYAALTVRSEGVNEKLKEALAVHQAGKTDYPTFCRDAAEAGVEKWTVDLIKMTCTYYDKAGNAMVVEKIPG